MKRCNMFKCAMVFLWSLFIAFFILLCLTSCEYEEPIKPDIGSVKDCVFDSVVLRTEWTTRQSEESSN